MRSRTAWYTAALAALSLTPVFVHAAALPFFGPIIPFGPEQTCALAWGAVIIVINNIIRFSLTMGIVFVLPLTIAYAGFMYVVNAVHPAGMEKAKDILKNTLIGLGIALVAWLGVDALMAVLYNPNAFGAQWYQIITTGGQDTCLTGNSISPRGVGAPPIGGGGGIGGGGVTPSGVRNAQCGAGNSACSVSALQAVGYTLAQANAMSCIAMTESSGNPYTVPSSTGACGTFQLIHGNWNDPSLHTGACSVSTSCNDPFCNAQAAYLLSQRRLAAHQSPYADWTCAGCNARAQSCVSQYDPTMVAIRTSQSSL